MKCQFCEFPEKYYPRLVYATDGIFHMDSAWLHKCKNDPSDYRYCTNQEHAEPAKVEVF